ncbi:efflux transporter outer membrane subunit [Bryobacter aggregatus]|uniref:efflux transporter outer membrane subunit n=1 Tax=Bryobacter aggregatus TaxID=360054 RepID=UPI0004E1276C|nr:efflux transporter outer membrane subunit [Bryobacter aggregatus]
MRIVAGLVLALVLFSTGCKVGPTYTKPVVPAPIGYKEADGWKTAQPADAVLRGRWWELFEDTELSALEERVAVSNESLKAAEARFRQARSLITYSNAARFPTISTSPGTGGLRSSANRPGFPANLTSESSANLNLPFDLSYELDLWGKIRRTIDASRDAAQASAADVETARLSLQAELAYQYYELRAVEAQQRVLQDTVKALENLLQLTTNRYHGGISPKNDVAQATAQLESTRADLTETGVARAQLEHAIAVLTGQAPADFRLSGTPSPLKPPVVPVGIPAQLLERRPDIAAMERRTAEANEQIGIAKAAFYPTVRFGLSGGVQGTSMLNWFSWPSRMWAVGPTAMQTLFDAGRRKSVSESAQAAYDATVANYRQTTLTAFQQVEDNLSTLRILEKEAEQQSRAIAAAKESLALSTNRYQGGVDTYLQVLTAQTIALTSERRAIDIQRRQMGASVLLIKALGGGWDTSQLPKL